MKRIQLVVLFICYMINTNAQPVLNSTEMLPIGSIIQKRYIQNFNVIDTTLQGPNKTWDFTTIQNSVVLSDRFIQIVAPLSTPYGATFPSSNYAYLETPLDDYSYYNLSSTKMELIGDYSTGISIYDDPLTDLVFPLSIGVSNLDSWHSSSPLGGFYNLYCIGSGTLMTPGGVYQDVLMVRVDFDVTTFALKEYIWYSSLNGAILLRYIVGDGVFVSDEAFYLASLDNNIKENDVVSNLKYNNPVFDVLQLAYHSKNDQLLNYTVRNSLGQILLSGQLPAFSNYSKIDFSKLSKGVYFVNIFSEKSQDGYTIKLVKM